MVLSASFSCSCLRPALIKRNYNCTEGGAVYAEIKALWAKKAEVDTIEGWLPLLSHMSDTAEVAKILWDSWASSVIKERIEKDLAGVVSGRDLFIFLASVHDIGKASPAFQFREGYKTPNVDRVLMDGLTSAGFTGSKHRLSIRHEYVTHCILVRYGVDHSVAIVVGGHHGSQPDVSDLYKIKTEHKKIAGFKSDEWVHAQKELLSEALAISGVTLDTIKLVQLTKPVQVLLSGLVVMADWMASNEKHFPLIPTSSFTATHSAKRAEEAFRYYDLPPLWRAYGDALSLYETRFNISTPYPVQEAVLRVAEKSPNLMIIEAPMGEGKTEASLAAAELIASQRGCRGVYFALPTQATTNAMFDRVVKWVSGFEPADAPYSARLMHGKAEYNDKYTSIKYRLCEDDSDAPVSNVQVHEWFEGSKKGILADFTVGTVDHILLAGLRRKHLTLRHLGLAGKVVIIDECHAYDTYMLSYLCKALTYLGAYQVPVIVLSATLPANTRNKLVSAYLGIRDTDTKKQAVETPTVSYPQITYVCGNTQPCVEAVGISSKVKSVSIRQLASTAVVSTLENVLAGGGYAGVIANTVRKAQGLYDTLSKHFTDAEVVLLHSGFMQVDRSKKEEYLVNVLGKEARRGGKKIVVGTQIFEQSMDIDLDVLITDLCPIDLLLQRIGRLHRHDRVGRPTAVATPTCYVMDTVWGEFDKGSMLVYGPYLLAKTRAILPDVINVPNDIPSLVANVYDGGEPAIPADYKSWYDKALKRYVENNAKREKDAKGWQISDPRGGCSPIFGWISGDTQCSEQLASATVRGSIDSLEVIPVMRKTDGFYPLPHLGSDPIPVSELRPDQAKQLAEYSLRLPYVFGINISKCEKELKKCAENVGLPESWSKSSWISDANFLIFDENGKATLGEYTLRYSPEKGLEYSE